METKSSQLKSHELLYMLLLVHGCPLKFHQFLRNKPGQVPNTLLFEPIIDLSTRDVITFQFEKKKLYYYCLNQANMWG